MAALNHPTTPRQAAAFRASANDLDRKLAHPGNVEPVTAIIRRVANDDPATLADLRTFAGPRLAAIIDAVR